MSRMPQRTTARSNISTGTVGSTSRREQTKRGSPQLLRYFGLVQHDNVNVRHEDRFIAVTSDAHEFVIIARKLEAALDEVADLRPAVGLGQRRRDGQAPAWLISSRCSALSLSQLQLRPHQPSPNSPITGYRRTHSPGPMWCRARRNRTDGLRLHVVLRHPEEVVVLPV